MGTLVPYGLIDLLLGEARDVPEIGDDEVSGGDADEVFGGEDNDEIDVADSDDVVDCGRSNNDKISSDPGDSLVGCEVFAEIPVQ